MMLRHPTLEKLQTLRLTGMVAAFHEHLHSARREYPEL